MRKAEKPFFIDNLSEQIKSASSFVLVDYTGLSVKMQQELKKRLRGAGGEMMVVKNTLFRLALDRSKVDKGKSFPSNEVLKGPTAVIITEADPIAPLTVLYRFSQEFEIPSLKVGIVEGRIQNKEELEKLAKLPSKEILFSQAVGVIASPMYQLVGSLKGNVQKLVWILKSKSSM